MTGFDTSRSYTVEELLKLLGPGAEVELSRVKQIPGSTDKTGAIYLQRSYSRSEVRDILDLPERILRKFMSGGHLEYADETKYITGQSLARFYTEFRGEGYVLLKDASARIAKGTGLGVNTVEQNFKKLFGESEYARNFGTDSKTLWGIREDEVDLLVEWFKNRKTRGKSKPYRPMRKRSGIPVKDRKEVAEYGRNVLKRYGIDHRTTPRLVEGGFLKPGNDGELTRESYDDFDSMMRKDGYVALRKVSYRIARGLDISENTLFAFGIPRLVGLVNMGTEEKPLYVVRRGDVNALIERSKPNFGRKGVKSTKPEKKPLPPTKEKQERRTAAAPKKRSPPVRNPRRELPPQEDEPALEEPVLAEEGTYGELSVGEPGWRSVVPPAVRLGRKRRTRRPPTAESSPDAKSKGLRGAYGDPLRGKYDKFRHLIMGD